jgi:4-diphosphocytidyl-2-C-methyl-D-erythritol kinase
MVCQKRLINVRESKPLAQNSPEGLSIFAPAKINLYLHIIGKRSNGLHILDSLVVFAGYGDIVSVTSSAELTLTIEGPFAKNLSTCNDNLVIKAAKTLAKFAGIEPKAHIILTKNIPVSAGVGGGSADATATLRALTELWKISLSKAELMHLAQKLGSDVSVCIAGGPSFMSGTGEKIIPAPILPNFWMVLVNPNVAVSTRDVFSKYGADVSTDKVFKEIFQSTDKMCDALATCKNDLTPAAITVAPVIQDVLGALQRTKGQMLVRLSGSGATCFAIFSNKIAAKIAAKNLSQKYPQWWVKAAAHYT